MSLVVAYTVFDFKMKSVVSSFPHSLEQTFSFYIAQILYHSFPHFLQFIHYFSFPFSPLSSTLERERESPVKLKELRSFPIFSLASFVTIQQQSEHHLSSKWSESYTRSFSSISKQRCHIKMWINWIEMIPLKGFSLLHSFIGSIHMDGLGGVWAEVECSSANNTQRRERMKRAERMRNGTEKGGKMNGNSHFPWSWLDCLNRLLPPLSSSMRRSLHSTASHNRLE